MIKLIEKNPALKPFEADLELRVNNYRNMKMTLIKKGETLSTFANAHLFYGFHHEGSEWVYREWAPAADALFLEGDFNSWNMTSHPLKKVDPANGVWEIRLPDTILKKGDHVKTVVLNGGRYTEHLPLYTTKAVQNHTDWMWVWFWTALVV